MMANWGIFHPLIEANYSIYVFWAHFSMIQVFGELNGICHNQWFYGSHHAVRSQLLGVYPGRKSRKNLKTPQLYVK